MRLVTIYLPRLLPKDEPPLRGFMDYLGGQMSYSSGSQATAAFVIISRAREKLARAGAAEGVEVTTSMHYAENALKAFDRFQDRHLGPWLSILRQELEDGITERLQREHEEEQQDAKRDFNAVARGAKTVRERYELHDGPPDSDGQGRDPAD